MIETVTLICVAKGVIIMSIRPVDMQLSVHKSTDVGRTHNQGSGQQEITQQQQFSEKLQKETTQMEQQVAKSDKSEKQNIDKDGRNGTGYHSAKRENAKKKKDDNEKSKSTSMFDVTI